MKKTLSFLLSLLLLLALVPTVSVAAAKDFEKLNENTLSLVIDEDEKTITQFREMFKDQFTVKELAMSIIVYSTGSKADTYRCISGGTKSAMQAEYTVAQLRKMISDEKHVWVYGEAVSAAAKWENTLYETAQEAIADALAAGNGHNVLILDDAALPETITVEKGQALKIDLNGNTLSGKGFGTLIDNFGTLTVYNGNSKKGALSLSLSGTDAVSGDAVGVENEAGATFNLNNASVTVKNSFPCRAIGVRNNGTFCVNSESASVSATASGDKEESCQAFALLAESGRVSTDGGIFTAEGGCAYTCAVCTFAADDKNLQVNLKNVQCRAKSGALLTDSIEDAVCDVNGSGAIKITSGIFSQRPEHTLLAESSLSERNIAASTTKTHPWQVSGESAGDVSGKYYEIKIAKTTGGAVKVDYGIAYKGKTVTVTTEPSDGYAVDSIVVYKSTKRSTEVTVHTERIGRTYTFVMPGYAVKIAVTYRQTDTFDDVSAGDYFYKAATWAGNAGIASGTEEGSFEPYAVTTRAEMVTLLWRAMGSPEAKSQSAFKDVKKGSYYYTAVAWAVNAGYINGTTEKTFSPDEPVTRAQAITMLARVSGVNEHSRKQSHGFTDVQSTDYYNNAVAWAKRNSVAEGTSAATFSPDEMCQRCQVVTFLWKTFG